MGASLHVLHYGKNRSRGCSREMFWPKREKLTGEKCTGRTFMNCSHHEILLGESNRKDEMGWECGTCGDKRGIQGFGGDIKVQ